MRGTAGAILLVILGFSLSLLLSPPASQQSQARKQTTQGSKPGSSAASASPSEQSTDTILGHRKYEEAPPETLVAIVPDGSLQLRSVAAQAWSQMEADARADGVYLTALSAFRSKETQQYLFFGVKEQRGQDAKTRAEVSAPPGYSEHHTGYALDVGDADLPATDLSEDFETTPAFYWLQDNAAHYGFELSFPKNNAQGVNYEPWHWRYVGNQDSLETFYKEFKPASPSETP
jgi:D-alanyl-D-alanine carboxypeptidase